MKDAQDRAVRLAVVGLGNWGKNVARGFAATPQCRLVRLCDTDPAALARHKALHPEAAAGTCFEELLRDRTVDAVALATPTPTHYEMARRALLAGKHVFVENPLAMLASEADELAELARWRGRKLMAGHLLEYHPAVELMKQYVDRGELGAIHYMYCQRLSLGTVRQAENAFWSLAPHDISVILHLFGDEPDRVTATGACFLQPGIEDVVFANLHFPDGRIAQIHVSWLDPQRTRNMVLVGSKKMLVFDDTSPTEKIRVFNKGAKESDFGDAAGPITIRHGDTRAPHVNNRPPLEIEAQHFVECILEDRPPRTDGRAGLGVVRVLEEVDRQLHRTEIHHGRLPVERFAIDRATTLPSVDPLRRAG